jgi:hypothetical protein
VKTAVVKIPFFINEQNMAYLLKGFKIGNLQEVHEEMLFKMGDAIYAEREHNDGVNEFPNISDKRVARAVRYIKGSPNLNDGLEVELLDSLYYHKLREPCIKVNGYCEIDDKGYMIITKVTRLTLADRNPIVSDINL